MSEISNPFYLYSIDKIGEFKLYRSYLHKDSNIYRGRKACFMSKDSIINLPRNIIVGYETIDGIFVNSPILISFLEIRTINYDVNIKGYLVDCIVFDKKYQDYKKIIIKTVQANHITDLEPYVNIINQFVNEGNDILSLKDEIDNSCLETHDAFDIIEIINDLKFRLYECSQSNPGKDNYFWQEVIISNIPTEIYLQDVLLQTLKDSYDISNKRALLRAEITQENTIKLTLNFESAYSPHIGRVERGEWSRSDEVKELLMILFYKHYSINSEMYSKVKIH